MSKLVVRAFAASLISALSIHCSGGSEVLSGAPANSGGAAGAQGNDEPDCDSGDTRACLGPGACTGAQMCVQGTWRSCDCGDNTGGGSNGDGGTGSDGGGGSSNGNGGTNSTGGANGDGGTSSGGANGHGGTSSGGTAGDGGSGGSSGGTTGGTGGDASGGTGGTSSGGTGGGGGSGGATGGTGGTGGSSGGSGGTGGAASGGTGGTSSGGSGGGASCQDLATAPVPPTVYVLVDRSGSIYDLEQWIPLREAVLPVIQAEQANVRFGFGSFSGTQPVCVGLEDMGTIALDNYAAIAAHYNSLPTTPAAYQETPIPQAIAQVVDVLHADTGSRGERVIFLVTADDDADFCNNTAFECGIDGTVGALQIAAAAGVRTYVFALDNAGIQHPEWLHYWAQAGVGQQPNWSQALSTYSGVSAMCQGVVPWYQARAARGKSDGPIGDYSQAGGTAQAFIGAGSAAVASSMNAKLSDLASCRFDLSGDQSIAPGGEDEGHVTLGGVQVPANQWRVNDPKQIELLGAACATYKSGTTALSVSFPCEALVSE